MGTDYRSTLCDILKDTQRELTFHIVKLTNLLHFSKNIDLA